MLFANELSRRYAVWRQGHIDHDVDPTGERYRRDVYGTLIEWGEYGNFSSPRGWEIDHIVSKALGGSDHISNLRPLACSINRSLGGLLGSILGR